MTGVGDVDGDGDGGAEELLATTGGDVVGEGECFVGVVCAAVGDVLGSGLAGVLFSGGTTGTVGVCEAELADAAEAD